MLNMQMQWVAAAVLAFVVAATARASESAEQLARNALALEGKAERGAQLFATECAGCHGRDAQGDAVRLVPALAGQRRAYLVKQLVDFAETERSSTPMHAVLGRSKLREPQAWVDVALHLNSLEPVAEPRTGRGRAVALGEAVYRERCMSCHADDARGDDDEFVPALRNQHYGYLVSAMRAMGQGHRINLDAETAALLANLGRAELVATADYLSRLRGPVRDRARLQDDGTLSK